jgi:hypothetical protein
LSHEGGAKLNFVADLWKDLESDGVQNVFLDYRSIPPCAYSSLYIRVSVQVGAIRSPAECACHLDQHISTDEKQSVNQATTRKSSPVLVISSEYLMLNKDGLHKMIDLSDDQMVCSNPWHLCVARPSHMPDVSPLCLRVSDCIQRPLRETA